MFYYANLLLLRSIMQNRYFSVLLCLIGRLCVLLHIIGNLCVLLRKMRLEYVLEV